MPVFISQRRIQSALARLARQIDLACHQARIDELVVVCVMDGAFIFTADLVRAMRTATRIVFLKATSYSGTRKGATSITALPASLRKGSVLPVLIVDTIYDTGRTIAKVVRQARRFSSKVWLAVLVEKHGKAAAPPTDQVERVFTGIRLSGDPFLIGYGLDVDGRFRNLPEIREYHPAPASRARPRAARRKR